MNNDPTGNDAYDNDNNNGFNILPPKLLKYMDGGGDPGWATQIENSEGVSSEGEDSGYSDSNPSAISNTNFYSPGDFTNVTINSPGFATNVTTPTGTVIHIDDGSNADFTLNDDGLFTFTGFSDQGGTNTINLATITNYYSIIQSGKYLIELKDVKINANSGGMSLSPQGLQFIEQFEGWRSNVYVDVNGHRTIGYGHLMLPSEHFTSISRSQGAAILNHDVRIAVNEVNSDLNFTPTQSQFDAIVDFTFNIGIGNFRNSSALQDLNSGDLSTVPGGLLQWTDHGAGYATDRRNAEINLFNNGVY